MSTFLGGSEIGGMYLGSNEISEMYLGSNLIYSSGWPYETLRISMDDGITWEDYGRPSVVAYRQFRRMGITHVELPDSITTFNTGAFEGNEIKSILLPDSVTNIWGGAFEGNKIEGTLYIPESIKSIGEDAFRKNQLTYVEFPETLESIGMRSFRDNPNLAEVRISSRTSYFGGTAYADTFDSHTRIIIY